MKPGSDLHRRVVLRVDLSLVREDMVQADIPQGVMMLTGVASGVSRATTSVMSSSPTQRSRLANPSLAALATLTSRAWLIPSRALPDSPDMTLET